MGSNIRISVNGPAFKKQMLSSLARLNNKKQIERNLKTTDGKILEEKFKSTKDAMIKDFYALPITQEIMAGPSATNTSGTLGGYGNLFSFIGFSQTDAPIAPIIALLKDTNFKLTGLTPRGTMKMIVELPSKEDIFSATPLPWAPGISWAQRMEVGLSGLGLYLNKPSASSRSGGGIQTDNLIRSGRFSNSPYISAFLKKWKDIFLKIDKAVKIK